MSIFKPRGFDSYIGKNLRIEGGIILGANTTLVIDGVALCSSVDAIGLGEGKVASKTTLRVGGSLTRAESATAFNINVHNVIITGKIECDEIRVEGTLAVKHNATLRAKKILYRKLIIETGAVVHGQMFHLDHVSEGEQV